MGFFPVTRYTRVDDIIFGLTQVEIFPIDGIVLWPLDVVLTPLLASVLEIRSRLGNIRIPMGLDQECFFIDK